MFQTNQRAVLNERFLLLGNSLAARRPAAEHAGKVSSLSNGFILHGLSAGNKTLIYIQNTGPGAEHTQRLISNITSFNSYTQYYNNNNDTNFDKYINNNSKYQYNKVLHKQQE